MYFQNPSELRRELEGNDGVEVSADLFCFCFCCDFVGAMAMMTVMYFQNFGELRERSEERLADLPRAFLEFLVHHR